MDSLTTVECCKYSPNDNPRQTKSYAHILIIILRFIHSLICSVIVCVSYLFIFFLFVDHKNKLVLKSVEPLKWFLTRHDFAEITKSAVLD